MSKGGLKTNVFFLGKEFTEMCVIVYKPAASKMPSLDDLRKCFEANPDGAGLMWPGDDGYVHIRKGLMTWDAFESAVLSRDFAGKPVVFHFRISTQGGIQPGLTHPFPVCGSYEAMRSLCVKSRMGLAHNGIIGLTSDGSKDHNDTMRFVKDFAYPVYKASGFHDQDGTLGSGLGDIAMGSRLAIMAGDGSVWLEGDWQERNGCYYSNLYAFRERFQAWERGGWGYWKKQ